MIPTIFTIVPTRLRLLSEATLGIMLHDLARGRRPSSSAWQRSRHQEHLHAHFDFKA